MLQCGTAVAGLHDQHAVFRAWAPAAREMAAQPLEGHPVEEVVVLDLLVREREPGGVLPSAPVAVPGEVDEQQRGRALGGVGERAVDAVSSRLGPGDDMAVAVRDAEDPGVLEQARQLLDTVCQGVVGVQGRVVVFGHPDQHDL